MKIEISTERKPGYDEHHILPQARYHEYKNDKENLIFLGGTTHNILHGKGSPSKGQRLEIIDKAYKLRKHYINSKGINLEDLITIYENLNNKRGKNKRIASKEIYPPFKHDGNKARLFGSKYNFRQYLPKNFDKYEEYVEPFAGSAGVFYKLVNDNTLKPEQHNITLNDYDIVTYTMHRGVMECDPYEILDVWRCMETEIKELFIDKSINSLWFHSRDSNGNPDKLNNRDLEEQKNYFNKKWYIIQRKLDNKSYRNPEIVAEMLTFKSYSMNGNFYNKRINKKLDLSRVGDKNLILGNAMYPKYKNNLVSLYNKLNEFKDGAGLNFYHCDYNDCDKLYNIEPFKSFWYIDPPYINTTCKYESKSITGTSFVDLLYKLNQKYAHFTFSIDGGDKSNYNAMQKRIGNLIKNGNSKYNIKKLKDLQNSIKVAEFQVTNNHQSYNSTVSNTLAAQSKKRGEGVIYNW
jgi:site-specific DNA-adenine methylase